MINKIVGLFAGGLAGYFLGMIAGFTLFDENLDVWALLSALFAIIGLGVGLMARFRRNLTLVLGALLGFYVGTLLRVPLFGVDDEFDLLENGIGSLICSLGGIAIGVWLGARDRRPIIAYTLFAALWSGFLGGAVLIALFASDQAEDFAAIAPLVLAAGVVIGGITWALLRQRQQVDTPS